MTSHLPRKELVGNFEVESELLFPFSSSSSSADTGLCTRNEEVGRRKRHTMTGRGGGGFENTGVGYLIGGRTIHLQHQHKCVHYHNCKNKIKIKYLDLTLE